jgi:calcineurin-like phosphoesterase family protein
MAEKWFISDTHFFHANILKFTGDDGKVIRPFNDITDMNEYIIRKWNNTVSSHDKVYHLGDVTFKYGKEFNELMSRLKGQKRLILGNHDKLKGTELMKWFEKVELWKGFKDGDFTATHIPLRLESLRDGNFNVHGHIHQNKMEDPHYINMCVEHWNYTPVNYDEIVAKIKAVR